jgi:hypothetical protein
MISPLMALTSAQSPTSSSKSLPRSSLFSNNLALLRIKDLVVLMMLIGSMHIYWSLQTTTIVRNEYARATTTCDTARFDSPMMRKAIATDPTAANKAALKDHHHHQQQRHCAINLYGLPRGFKDYVLPSFTENIIKVNVPYHCDYFVHFFNKTEETSGRSGAGGSVDPSEVLLLKQAVENVYRNHSQYSTHTLPLVEFVSDTDDDFFRKRKNTLRSIQNYPQVHNTTTNPYYTTVSGYDDDTSLNIFKMWHSQTRVFERMDQVEATNGRVNQPVTLSYYSRVAMLRLDVVFMTPIDIYKVPNDPSPDQYSVTSAVPGSSWKNPLVEPISNPNYYFYDLDNKHAVIPGFASFPINDRMIMGPYETVKIWATQRWHLHEEYICLITTNPNKFALRKFGLHDERMLAHLVIPLMRRQQGVQIMVDRNLYFSRVRADGSIWILDSPFAQARWREPEKLQLLLQRNCTSFQSNTKISPWQAKCPVKVENADESGGDKQIF